MVEVAEVPAIVADLEDPESFRTRVTPAQR